MKEVRLSTPPTIMTIGHSTRTSKEFIQLLKAHRVERLVDVRAVPRSRHNPQFNRDRSTPASAAAIPNWLELSLPVQVTADPLDANVAEATPRP
jgi:hypothetical protein